MIRPTPLFEIRHPFLSMLVLLSNVVVVVLLLWGWTELRFSPLQRHYLPYYFAASNTRMMGNSVSHVEWIEKIGPGKKPETALPDDVVSAPAEPPEGVPFRLSQVALDQDWMDVREHSEGSYQAGVLSEFLEAKFFDDRSFLILFLQPFEILLIGYVLKKGFDSWREDLARERGWPWDPSYRPTTWSQDLSLLVRTTSRGAKAGTIQSWRWIKVQRQNVRRPEAATRIPAEVRSSSAQPTSPKRVTPEVKTPVPVVATVVKIVAERSSGVTVPKTKPQPVAAQDDAKPTTQTPKSPFGKSSAEGEPERRWDLSQWID